MPVRRPKLADHVAFIDQILDADDLPLYYFAEDAAPGDVRGQALLQLQCATGEDGPCSDRSSATGGGRCSRRK